MLFSPVRNTSSGSDITVTMKSSQAKNAVTQKRPKKRQPKTAVDSEFGERLLRAYPGKNLSQIADVLEISNSNLTRYVKKGEIPSIHMLLKISDQTGKSIHWLATGSGSETVVPAITAPTDSALLRDFVIDALRVLVLNLYRNLSVGDRHQVQRFIAEQFKNFPS